MRDIYFGDFRHAVITYIKQIDNTNPAAQSIEWFLLRYLRRIVKVTEPPAQPARVEGAVRALIRFYLDNLDEKSGPGNICSTIYEQYRKVLRDNQSQDQVRN